MRIVNAVIFNNNKLLCVKRRKNPYIGMYSLPGGHVERDESDIDALKRELKEETNLDVEVKISDYIGEIFISYENINNLLILYKAKVIAGKERIQVDEISEIKHLSVEFFLSNLEQHKFPESYKKDLIKFFKLIKII
ncbi:MAG TPA: NUDIX hydrolase [Nanoarchaeota archaeon]|nr:NUDIX hydrolase [Nanoarchaeota archaeon]